MGFCLHFYKIMCCLLALCLWSVCLIDDAKKGCTIVLAHPLGVVACVVTHMWFSMIT